MKIIKESVNMNESHDKHLESDVASIVADVIDNALDNLAMVIASEGIGYNPDWCIDESSYRFVHDRAAFIDSIVRDLFAYRGYEDEDEIDESCKLNELNLKNVDADELQYQKDMKAYKDSLTPNEAISDKIYNQLTNTAYNKKYGAKAIDYEAVLLDEEDNNVVCADDMTRALNVCEKEGYKHSEPRPLGKGENGSVYGSYKMTIYNPKV